LLAGALAGWIAVPREGRVAVWRGGRWVDRAGSVALGMIYACAAAALVATLRTLAG
jgi:hypothetical protein